MITQAQKDDWIQALRSGEYKQDQGWLCSADGFCCLGVLADRLGLFDPSGSDLRSVDSSNSYLPDDVLPRKLQGLLSELNDGGHAWDEVNEVDIELRVYPFDEIADYIEANLDVA